MTDVSTCHPDITQAVAKEWRQVEACAKGGEYIKERGEAYLPCPSGFKAMPDQGVAAYSAYKDRATFPEMFEPTVSSMVGMIHDKGIKIEAPDALLAIMGDGMTLGGFHRSITRQLLTSGRCGVLADAPANGGEVFLTKYNGDQIINWDTQNETGLDLVVLDETDWVRDGYRWTRVPQYRVLKLEGGSYIQELWAYGSNKYRLAGGFPKEVTIQGGGRMDFIPFACGNAREMGFDIESPPLIGVAQSAISNYQLSADYRHQLFSSGQETLVIINGDAPEAVGAGVVLVMSGDDTRKPEAFYVSPDCKGIDSHRTAMEEYRMQAAMAGARLVFREAASGQESGEARRLRFSSETASVLTVAQVSCSILEAGLKHAAIISGVDPEEVSIQPPTDLLDKTLTPTEAKALFDIYAGDGMSFETFYYNLQKGGLAPEGEDAAEEFGRIEDAFDNRAEGAAVAV